jgi:hypothetical protein
VDQGAQSVHLLDQWRKNDQKTSKITTAQLNERLHEDAPSTGLLVVEIFYHYDQIFDFLPYELDVHAYSIMPLSSVEATPTP